MLASKLSVYIKGGNYPDQSSVIVVLHGPIFRCHARSHFHRITLFFENHSQFRSFMADDDFANGFHFGANGGNGGGAG